MLIRMIKSPDDIEACVRMYERYNNGQLPYDFNRGLVRLTRKWRSGEYLKVAEDDGKIIAWLNATLVDHDFFKGAVLQQFYYCSEQHGFKSARCVRLLHDDLVKYAKAINVSIVLSPSSHVDTACVFGRLLEKAGWSRIGYLNYINLKD